MPKAWIDQVYFYTMLTSGSSLCDVPVWSCNQLPMLVYSDFLCHITLSDNIKAGYEAIDVTSYHYAIKIKYFSRKFRIKI